MSGDAVGALRRVPRWAVAAACVLALALTWSGWKLSGLSQQDSLTLDVASGALSRAYVGYSSAPFGLPTRQHPIAPQEVTPPKVAARATTVTVTPLGQANPKSQGNEVWVVEVASEYARVGGPQWAQMALPQPWKASGESALNAQGAPVPLPVGLDAGAYVDVRLVTHPWSGRVRIDAAGSSQEVDLYASESGQKTFRLLLPVSPDVPRRITTTIPRAAGDLTLGFSAGPQTVVLAGAQRRGAADWTFGPQAADALALGPGVKVLGRESGGVRIEIPEGGGWVRLHGTAVSYWTPRLKDLAVVLGIWLVILGVCLLGLAAYGAVAGAVAVFGALRPARPGGWSARGRWQGVVDGVFLVAVCVWLFVLVGGALQVVREVTVRVANAEEARVKDATVLVPSRDNLAAWAPESPRLWRWWAQRPVPHTDGGDYLRVLSRESGETIADILGVAVARLQTQGATVERVIIPRDLEALYGQPPFSIGQGVGGNQVRIGWQDLRDTAAYFTDVPFTEKSYDPVLTEQELAGIPAISGSEPAWSSLVVAGAPPAASGTWVLYAMPTTPRRYLLIPIESAPEGRRP